jgi:hypothetical protein
VDADDVVLERLLFLRNEADYLRGERDQVHSFPEYQENIRLRKATERGLHYNGRADEYIITSPESSEGTLST